MLPFLPGIAGVTAQNGVKVDLRGAVSQESGDSLGLTNFTVLRYPAN